MNTEETNNQLATMGYSLKSTLIRDHEWGSNRMADWSCQLTGPNGKSVTVEYHTGKAHRQIKGVIKKTFPMNYSFADWSNSKASDPNLADVIHSLLLDSSASDQSFDDWCGDLGYDPDSRKALDTYLACQNAGSQLRSIGADIVGLQTLLEDY